MINKVWHDAHKMPKNASYEVRVKWHVAHAKACGCRKPPESVRADVERALRGK